jgi:hypothetical protein
MRTKFTERAVTYVNVDSEARCHYFDTLEEAQAHAEVYQDRIKFEIVTADNNFLLERWDTDGDKFVKRTFLANRTEPSPAILRIIGIHNTPPPEPAKPDPYRYVNCYRYQTNGLEWDEMQHLFETLEEAQAQAYARAVAGEYRHMLQVRRRPDGYTVEYWKTIGFAILPEPSLARGQKPHPTLLALSQAAQPGSAEPNNNSKPKENKVMVYKISIVNPPVVVNGEYKQEEKALVVEQAIEAITPQCAMVLFGKNNANQLAEMTPRSQVIAVALVGTC